MTTQIEKTVANYVASIGVKFKAHFIPQTLPILTKDARLNFKCDFVRGNTVATFDYFKGQGHCLANQVKKARLDRCYYTKTRLILDELQTGRCELGLTKKPNICELIYCLLSDYDAGKMTFDDFCDYFGYNADSITDYRLHQACIESAKKLELIFKSCEIETLRNLTQDY